MSIHFVESGRRRGTTTALIDIAVMNALAGQRVAFLNRNWPEADHSFGLCAQRIIACGLQDRFDIRLATLNLAVKDGEGRIDFVSQRHAETSLLGDPTVIDDTTGGIASVHFSPEIRKIIEGNQR